MTFKTALMGMAAIAVGACSASGSPDAVDRMPRAEVEAIIKDYLVANPDVLQAALVEVKELEARQTFASLLVNPDDPTLGPKDAPITIVEFFDYNCGFCKQANDWLFEQVDGREGDVRVVFKEYPILAQSSLDATAAAMAAHKQDKYREMHVALMSAPEISREVIDKAAESIGLDLEQFKADRSDPSLLELIQRVREEAELAGVEGTPGFFINGAYHSGFRRETMQQILEDARAAL